jgi:ribonucleoside-diphosphate reductase alpha chain
MGQAAIKISQTIIGQEVIKKNDGESSCEPANTLFKRHPMLEGVTYKIKQPDSEHAVYVTINHTTVDGQVRLAEIFVNSKSMTNFPWVVALTRVVSAIFRHEARPIFLVEELRSIFDPKGGYWSDGRYVPSLVAGIGNCLHDQMIKLGILESQEAAPHDQQGIKTSSSTFSGQPKAQAICEKCGAFAVVFSGGCDKCLDCGFSRQCSDS